MTTRTTIADVTFTRRFKLPNMERAYPPGIYQIEVDQESLDTVSLAAYRRTATRIRLHSAGLMQVLTIDPKDLGAALVDDALPATGKGDADDRSADAQSKPGKQRWRSGGRGGR